MVVFPFTVMTAICCTRYVDVLEGKDEAPPANTMGTAVLPLICRVLAIKVLLARDCTFVELLMVVTTYVFVESPTMDAGRFVTLRV